MFPLRLSPCLPAGKVFAVTFLMENSPTGAAIQVKSVGARKTYYTDEQKLFK